MSKSIDAKLRVTSTQAAERANIANVENISNAFGKIRKYFADLKSGAFVDDVYLVRQTNVSTSNYRPILMGYNNSSSHSSIDSEVTNQVYHNANIFVKPSTGSLYATGFVTTDRLDSGYGSTLNNNGLNLGIRYTNSSGTTYSYDRTVLKTVNGGVTESTGLGLYIDSGGLTVIGGGESAASLSGLISDDQSVSGASKLNVSGSGSITAFTNTSEAMIVSSDSSIYFVTNCNTIANRRATTLSSSQEFYPDVTGSGSIGTSTYHWGSAYIDDGHVDSLYLGGSSDATITYDTTTHRVTIPAAVVSNTETGTGCLAIFNAVVHPENGESYKNEAFLVSDGIKYQYSKGTSSSVGYSYIALGNSISSGNEWNETGGLVLYNNSGGAVEILPNTSNTANKTSIYLPSTNGTLALQSEITITNNTIGSSGNGNVISAISISNTGQLNVTKGITALTSSSSLNPANLSGAVPVNRGGTGAATLTSGYALIGNGTSAVNLRAIENTALSSASTSLATSGVVYAAIGGPKIIYKDVDFFIKSYTWKAVGSSSNKSWWASGGCDVSSDFSVILAATLYSFSGIGKYMGFPRINGNTSFSCHLHDVTGGTNNPGTDSDITDTGKFIVRVFGIGK